MLLFVGRSSLGGEPLICRSATYDVFSSTRFSISVVNSLSACDLLLLTATPTSCRKVPLGPAPRVLLVLRIELRRANTRMSRIRILQAWVIISAALLWSASVVAAQDEAQHVNEEHENNDDTDEAGAPAIRIALRPQIQGTMQFVTEEEMMNRFGGDNTTARFEGGLRGSSSSSPPPPVPSLPAATSSLPQHYIINGEDADAGAYPWFAQAIIRFKNGGFMLGGCGAVLIAPDWIATAATALMVR